MMMFSLAGIPPLAGFFAKWYVFLAAIHAGLYWLAVIGMLASVVAAFYYLRIVKIMYFDESARAVRPGRSGSAAVMATWASSSSCSVIRRSASCNPLRPQRSRCSDAP